MKCIHPSDIYLYLEGELTGQRKADFESHIASCQKCRQSLEHRRYLFQGINEIPPYKVPKGFTNQVLSRIETIKPTPVEWLKAGAYSLIFLSILTFLFLIFSQQGFTEFSTQFLQSIINSSQDTVIVAIKFIKSIYVFIQIFIHLLGLTIKSILAITPVVPTEIQIFTIFFSIFITVTVIFSLKQKHILGDKR